MSGKWHVASSLTKPTDTWPLQRGFDEFYGTIIGAGSFYDPNTLTRGNDNIEHEAKADSGFFYTDAISDQAVAFIETHRARARRRRRSSPTSPTPRRTGRCTRTTRTSPSTRAASTRAGTSCARSGSTSSSTSGILNEAWKLSRARPDAAAVDGRRAQGVAAALHGGLRGADRPHGPGHRPHPRARSRRPASSTTRSSSSSPTTAPAPRTSPRTSRSTSWSTS